MVCAANGLLLTGSGLHKSTVTLGDDSRSIDALVTPSLNPDKVLLADHVSIWRVT